MPFFLAPLHFSLYCVTLTTISIISPLKVYVNVVKILWPIVWSHCILDIAMKLFGRRDWHFQSIDFK